MRHLLITVIAATCCYQTAFAEVGSNPSASDDRIRSFFYEPDQVYRINGSVGYVQTISFDDNEVITTIEVGDSETWKIVPHNSKNKLSLKPVSIPNQDTNLTITTDVRTYTFLLKAQSKYSKVEAFRYQFDFPIVAETTVAKRTVASAYQSALREGVKVNLDYRATGDPILRPVKMWDDGEQTFITLNKSAPRAAVFQLVDKKERLVNTSDLEDGTIVVDGVFSELTIRDGRYFACLFNSELYEYQNEVRP